MKYVSLSPAPPDDFFNAKFWKDDAGEYRVVPGWSFDQWIRFRVTARSAGETPV